MNLIHVLAANWMVHALGWTLLAFCWQGAVVAVVLWSGLQLLAGRSARARYAAACCALALLVALPLLTFWHMAGVEYRLTLHGAGVAAASALVVGAGAGDASWTGHLAAALEPMLPWVMLAWMVGCAVFMLRLSVGIGVTRKLRLMAVSPVAEELQAIFTGLKQRLGVTRTVVLMHSALVQVPTVIGWLRPMVLIPVSCFAGMPLEQVEAILCHELAHIRRHDYLVSVAQSVVEALLFYHPGVWWISQQVRRERECCCDDVAVTVGGDALAYARALTALEARRSTYPQVMLGADGGVLTMRIKRLLIAEGSSTAGQVAAVVVLGLLAVSGLGIVSTARAEVKPVTEIVAAPRAVEGSSPAGTAVTESKIADAPKAKREAGSLNAESLDAESLNAGSSNAAQPAVMGSGVTAPVVVYAGKLEYSEEARRAKVGGNVLVHLEVDENGSPEHVRVVRGVGYGLDEKSVAAVEQYKFRPAMKDGKAVIFPLNIEVNWKLSDDAPSLEEPRVQQGPVRISAGVMAGEIVYKSQPAYPEVAKAAKVEGAVVLKALISGTGDIEGLQVISGPEMLRASALEAVWQWKYKPYLLNGQPTAVESSITVTYTLAP